jgi:hypothetical protein
MQTTHVKWKISIELQHTSHVELYWRKQQQQKKTADPSGREI